MKNEKAKKKPGKHKRKPSVKDFAVPGAAPEHEGEREVTKKEAFAAFIRWTILTKAERKAEKAPKTQGEFATRWGVDEATLSDWKKRGDFEKYRSTMFRKKLADDVPEVMADLRKRIKKYGQGLDVELYLAYAEGFDRKKVIEIKPPVTLNENDIRVLVSKLPPEKQKEFYDNIARLLAAARTAADDL